jgi:hypothetical protein
MTNWRYSIDLNSVLASASERHDMSKYERKCPKTVKMQIAAELRKAPPLQHFAKQIEDAESIAEVNRIIDEVYDAADANLIWCGL